MKQKFMMVSQPIKDISNRMIGHELLYFGDNQAFGEIEPSFHLPGSESDASESIFSFLQHNSNQLFSNSLNFMTFTPALLMKQAPHLFPPDQLVIQIDDSVIIHPLALQFLKKYSQEGYRIAVNEFQFQPRYLSLMNDLDYIKLNIQTMSESALDNLIEIAHSRNKQCIVTNIDNEALYHQALKANADALEGAYVSERLSNVSHSRTYLQSNFFRLVVAVTKEDPDLEEIVQLISLDATLSYALLRLANTAIFSSRNRVTSIQQAIITLGLRQLKQWVYMFSSSKDDDAFDPNSEEFLKLSFLRANFCSELMAYAKNLPISKSDAYLMGMFSTLHHLIDAPLEEILSEIPLPSEVKAALLTHEGPVGQLYELVLNYERAAWNEIPPLANALGISPSVLTTLYFTCVEDVNLIWKQLSEGNPAPANLPHG